MEIYNGSMSHFCPFDTQVHHSFQMPIEQGSSYFQCRVPAEPQIILKYCIQGQDTENDLRLNP